MGTLPKRVAVMLVFAMLFSFILPQASYLTATTSYQNPNVDSPSIQVLSPNGGEFWQRGSTQQVTWTSSGVTGEVRIEISYNEKGTWKALIDPTENDGSYQWTITGSISSACRIRISSIGTPGIVDESDANFDIWDFKAWEPLTAGINGGSGVVAVAIKPNDSNIVLAGRAADGGCYRSTDGGQTWEPDVGVMSSTNIWEFAWVSGTSTVFAIGDRVFRSTDDGASWEQIATSTGGLRCIAIDPNDPSIIYVGNGGGGGVFRSTDSGDTWSQTGLSTSAAVLSITIDPLNSQRIYAATGGSFYTSGGEGVFRSLDGGDSWASMNDGLQTPLDTRYLAFTPSTATNHYLYCGTHENGIYRCSYTEGQTWTHASTGFTAPCAEVIAIDSNNPGILYASNAWPPLPATENSNGLFKSTDGGDTWTRLDPILTGVGIAIDPSNSSKILMSNWYESIILSEDQGVTWNPSNIGFGRAFGGAASPTRTNTLFAFYSGPYWDPMLKSLDGGMNWTKSASGIYAEGVELVVDPFDANTLYEAQGFGSGVYRTTDSGENWYPMNSGLPVEEFVWPNSGVRTLVCDPTTPGRLFAGTCTGGVYIYEDGLWSQRNNGLRPGSPDKWVDSIVVDHRDPDIPPVLYASVREAGIFRSADGGFHWIEMNSGFPTQAWCPKIVMDKDDPLILYAATWDGVYKTITGGAETMNGGAGWSLVGEPCAAEFIAMHPQNPDLVYVGYFGKGVYWSKNRGTNWDPMNQGLINKRFNWMGVEPNNPGYLFLGNQRGLYRFISPSLYFTDLDLYQPVEAGNTVEAVLGGVMNNPATENGGVPQQVRARLQLINLDPSLISLAQYQNPNAPDAWITVTPTSDGTGGSYLWMDAGYSLQPGESKHCHFRLTVSASAPVGMHRTAFSLIEEGTNWVLATKTGQLTVVQESAPVQTGVTNLAQTGEPMGVGTLPRTGVQIAVTGTGTVWGGIYQGQPTGTTTPNEPILQYLDVCFSPEQEYTGTVTVIVRYSTPERPSLKVPGSFRYWDGSVWRPADPQVNDLERETLIGHVPAVYLRGTPLALVEAVTASTTLSLNGGWNLISLPLITSPRPLEVFSALPQGWVLFAWDGINSRYLGGGQVNLAMGNGYWLKLPGNSPLNIEVSGISVTDFETTIPLATGWNIIGVPYPGNFAWDAPRIRYQGNDFSLDEAANQNLIAGVAYYWTGSGYGNAKFGVGFQTGKGYWLKAKQSGCSLILFKP